MAAADVVEWEVEEIPDAHHLFLRVHVSLLVEGRLHPGVFRQHGTGMSTDWEKYSSPETCRDRAPESERPRNGIVALVAGGVREVPDLAVIHSPNVELRNRSHSDVLGISGINKTRARKLLFDRFHSWTLPPADL